MNLSITLRTGGLKYLLLCLNKVKASSAAVFGFCNSRLSKWRRALKPSISGSELVRYHDLSAEADAEGINTESINASRYRLHFGHTQASLSATLNLGDFDASRYPCGSVIQPSELGCATLTLHGFDALRHRLHFGHTHASLSATLNLDDVIARSGISAMKTSKLVFAALDLHAVHLTKAVFRGTQKLIFRSAHHGI